MNVGPMTSSTTFTTVEDALRDALSDWDLQGVPDGENGNYGQPIRELLGGADSRPALIARRRSELSPEQARRTCAILRV